MIFSFRALGEMELRLGDDDVEIQRRDEVKMSATFLLAIFDRFIFFSED
jgi:hypothetical protein